MPRLQVYLPQDLYDALKANELPASELLQEAVRAELRRRTLTTAADEHLAHLAGHVGSPSQDEQERADAIARRIATRRGRRAG